MVADSNTLYIVSGEGRIYRHALNGSGEALEPFELIPGSWPQGIDLSPDQKWLVVADGKLREAADARWLTAHVIELATGRVERVDVDRAEPDERGTQVPLFVDARTVLVSVQSSIEGTPACRLRRYHLDQGGQESEALPCASWGALLAGSADGNAVLIGGLFAPGALIKHDLRTGQTQTSWTNAWSREVALNRDGSEIAAVVPGWVLIEGAPYERTRLGGSVAPLGAVYSPIDDVLYVSWDFTRGWFIDSYETGTWRPLSIVAESPVGRSGYGHLRISRDGRLLFATEPGGVGIYPVGDERSTAPDAGFPPVPRQSLVERWPEHSENMLAFAPLGRVTDVVHDARRERLYVATAETGFRGQVLRWDMSWDARGDAPPGPGQGNLLVPLPLDGRFDALDLSPSQGSLVAVDTDPAPDGIVVQVVDLEQDLARRVTMQKRPHEMGAHDAVYLDDQTLLVTSYSAPEQGEPVPLRRVDLRDGSVTEVAEVGSGAVLSRSADGRHVVLTWSAERTGLLRYDVESGAIERFEGDGSAFSGALDRKGEHAILLSREDGAQVVDQHGLVVGVVRSTFVNEFGHALVAAPSAATYSPVADVLFVAWPMVRREFDRPGLAAHDARTLEPTIVFEPWENADSSMESLRTSRDGSRLFALSVYGVAIYDTSGLNP